MKKVLLFLTSALVFAVSSKAQMKCGTDQVCNKLREQHPEIKEWEIQLGAAIKEAIDKEKATGTIFAKKTATVYDIPLVVHIVHDYGAEYLTDDEIFEAVKYWDIVFNKQNPDTVDVIPNLKKYIGNPEIRLRLATKDPSGNATKGITRRQSYMTTRGSDEAKIDLWPNNKYLNIWFINKFDASHSGAAAYAYYPSTAAFIPHFDGIIGQAGYISTDKAIPHEIGHSLNLQHTWGSTNNPGVACGDDQVDDTPPTYGHSSCTITDLYDTRCATGYTSPLTGAFIPNSPLAADTVNTQNIMDYSYCAKMFTIGQADRMRASLTSSVAGRNNLYSSANLTSTGALLSRPELKPIADFSVEKGVLSWGGQTSERTVFLCQNSTTRFQFKNRSWNDTVTNVSWNFSNDATAPTSTSLSGSVLTAFNKSGWATVSLDATGNNSGTSNVSRQAIYVASTTAKNVREYAQYFSSYGDLAEWPMFNHYNNNFKWEYMPSVGHPNANGCIRYRSFDARTNPERYTQPQDGDFDDIYTPAFDMTTLSSTGNVNLNFFTSGCITSASSYGDSLQIFASTNCGDSWVRIAGLTYANIINNIFQNSEFAPTNASQWKAQTIAVPSALRTNKTFFRFRYWPSFGGNNFYLDNFSITPWTTEIKDVAQNASEVKLFPNPTSGNTKICFTASSNGQTTIVIRDMTGKLIHSQIYNFSPNTFVQHEIQRNLFSATGVYLITLTQDNQTNTQKLIIE